MLYIIDVAACLQIIPPLKLSKYYLPSAERTITSITGPMTNNNELQDRQPRIAVTIATFCLCIFLACLDAVIIGNALPAIAEDLHAPPGSYAWVGAAYNMARASLLLTWGRISDIFGRRPVLLTGAVVFFVGSIIAAMSRSFAALLTPSDTITLPMP